MTDTYLLCPICGVGGTTTRRYNGTCSPDCARTKATVDAFKALHDFLRCVTFAAWHPEVQWVRCVTCGKTFELGKGHVCDGKPAAREPDIVVKVPDSQDFPRWP